MDVAKYQIEYTYFKKYFLFCKSITTNIIYPGKISSIIPSLFFSFIMHKSSNYFFVFTSYCDNSTFSRFSFFFYTQHFPHFQNYNNFNKFPTWSEISHFIKRFYKNSTNSKSRMQCNII